MPKSKLILAIILILILTLFLAGCGAIDNLYDTLCCIPGMFSLPVAVICIKLIS